MSGNFELTFKWHFTFGPSISFWFFSKSPFSTRTGLNVLLKCHNICNTRNATESIESENKMLHIAHNTNNVDSNNNNDNNNHYMRSSWKNIAVYVVCRSSWKPIAINCTHTYIHSNAFSMKFRWLSLMHCYYY